MKIKNLFTVVLLILSVEFAFCNDKNAECGKFILTETEFVSWCITPNVVSENSENIEILENRTERELAFGTSVFLEYFNGNDWENVHINVEILSVVMVIDANEVDESNGNFYWFVREFNNSKKGKYRVVRQYTLLDDRRSVDFTLHAEFVVE